MTRYPELFAALAAEFPQNHVRSLSKGSAKIFYITARIAMNRLDEVLGPENWYDSYRPGGESSVVCSLTLRLPDGTTITKEDAGGSAGMNDAGDDDKSAYSDAFKRAAVKFGVGRYLYRDGVPSFPIPSPDPEAPNHAELRRVASSCVESPSSVSAPASAPTRVNTPNHDGPPRTGRGLYAWARDQETTYGVGLVKYLDQWAKLQDFPRRMVEWGADQVDLAYQEASRKLDSLGRAAAG